MPYENFLFFGPLNSFGWHGLAIKAQKLSRASLWIYIVFGSKDISICCLWEHISTKKAFCVPRTVPFYLFFFVFCLKFCTLFQLFAYQPNIQRISYLKGRLLQELDQFTQLGSGDCFCEFLENFSTTWVVPHSVLLKIVMTLFILLTLFTIRRLHHVHFFHYKITPYHQ